MTDTPVYGLTELVSGQAIPETTVNEYVRNLEQGARWFGRVKDRDENDPPGSPADGDCYLVAAIATGAWTGQEGKIAFYMSTAWEFITVLEGDGAWFADENIAAVYNGATWDALATGGSYTDEMAQDAVGTIMTDTGLAVVTYNDATPSIDVNVPAASSATTNSGSSATEAVTPDGLAGSNFGMKTIEVMLSDPNGSAITTGDGKAFVRITSDLNGMNLVGCGAVLDTAGTGGGYLMQLRRKRSGSDVDMLSTRISIDSGENDSADAGTPPAINGSNDDIATGDRIYFDRDGVPTGAKGDVVWMQFQLP